MLPHRTRGGIYEPLAHRVNEIYCTKHRSIWIYRNDIKIDCVRRNVMLSPHLMNASCTPTYPLVRRSQQIRFLFICIPRARARTHSETRTVSDESSRPTALATLTKRKPLSLGSCYRHIINDLHLIRSVQSVAKLTSASDKQIINSYKKTEFLQREGGDLTLPCLKIKRIIEYIIECQTSRYARVCMETNARPPRCKKSSQFPYIRLFSFNISHFV